MMYLVFDCLQGVTHAFTASTGVSRATASDQGAEDVSERVTAGAEPLAGTLRPAERAAPGPGHLYDQTGQPL